MFNLLSQPCYEGKNISFFNDRTPYINHQLMRAHVTLCNVLIRHMIIRSQVKCHLLIHSSHGGTHTCQHCLILSPFDWHTKIWIQNHGTIGVPIIVYEFSYRTCILPFFPLNSLSPKLVCDEMIQTASFTSTRSRNYAWKLSFQVLLYIQYFYKTSNFASDNHMYL